MNWDQMEGKWKQMRGSVKQQWGKLTDSDLDQIAGKRDVLLGKLQERYGIAREEAQRKADEWLKTVMDTSNADQSQTARPEAHQTAKY
jgi:uncharacterized protein YjbJ (UPF0337 family)